MVNGTLNLTTNNVTGTSGFTLSSGATLRIGNASGITSTASSGSVQVTGTRTFSTGANYVYTGTTNQATGDQLPAKMNTLTIANTGTNPNNIVTITRSGNDTLNSGTSGALTLTSGVLKLTSSTDSLIISSGGGVTATSGDFSSASSGGIKFLGTGTVTGTVNFYPGVMQAPSSTLGVTYSSGSTIQTALTLNPNSFVNSQAPAYASTSTLTYNTGGTYGRSTEWSSTAASGNGYPGNVTLSNNTLLDMGANSGAAVARFAAGNLTIGSGSTFSLSLIHI